MKKYFTILSIPCLLAFLTAGNIYAGTSPALASAAATVVPTPSAVPDTTTKSKKKKKAVMAVTPQATPVTASTPGQTPTKAAAVATLTPSAEQSKVLLDKADKAYADKNYSEAVTDYGEYIKKFGENPEVDKKLLLAKFYEGQTLVSEARDGFKEKEKVLKMDDESHNFMVYGKRHPSREAHPFTVCAAFLTPLGVGGDLSYTIAAHWNIGFGVGYFGWDPRLKYYFNGDGASFYLGMGLATYNFNSGTINIGSSGNGGSGSFSFSGSFLHFTLGPSFQDPDGTFLEAAFDVGAANITGQGNGNVSSGGGSAGGSQGFTYNGLFGTIGMRAGYSF